MPAKKRRSLQSAKDKRKADRKKAAAKAAADCFGAKAVAGAKVEGEAKAAAAAPPEKAEAKAASAEVPLAKGINIVNKCITHTLTFITHSILIASLSVSVVVLCSVGEIGL